MRKVTTALLIFALIPFLMSCDSSDEKNVTGQDGFSSGETEAPVTEVAPGTELAKGWNTWDTNSVLSHVLLPQGLAIKLQIQKGQSGEILEEALIGRSEFDSKEHWQMTMRGHAAANIVPVVASNRVGTETSGDLSMDFYGSSFISNHTGQKVAEADRESQTVLTHTFDLAEIAEYRRDWGVFRDRRPDLYESLLTLDGKQAAAGS